MVGCGRAGEAGAGKMVGCGRAGKAGADRTDSVRTVVGGSKTAATRVGGGGWGVGGVGGRVGGAEAVGVLWNKREDYV